MGKGGNGQANVQGYDLLNALTLGEDGVKQLDFHHPVDSLQCSVFSRVVMVGKSSSAIPHGRGGSGDK